MYIGGSAIIKLKFASFLTQVLAKESKMIFVMMGKLVFQHTTGTGLISYGINMVGKIVMVLTALLLQAYAQSHLKQQEKKAMPVASPTQKV